MKMKKALSLAVAAWLLTLTMVAAPVSESTAHRVACSFWNTFRPLTVKPVDSMQALSFDEIQKMYVFANGEQGFVVVAADDCVQPILGYSFEEPFANREPNPALTMWLKAYERQIEVASEADRPTDARWRQLLTGVAPSEPLSLQNVPRLVKTRWDQGNPYNRLCPYDSSMNDRAVVGCVATAMAQIMKYWNHPSSGTGSNSYEPHTSYEYGTLTADFEHTPYLWSQMPNEVFSSATDEEALGVSMLSYHCGVAVNMMYGVSAQGGSAAYSSCYGESEACAVNAFRNNFKYDSRLEFHNKDDFSDSVWLSMIDAELAQGHPLYYNGYDMSSGHAFVLDGSDLDTHYHFNWGWSGYGNGYYAINNLAPGGGGAGSSASHTYNLWQGAIFGLVPIPETFDTVEMYDTVCSGKPYYSFREYSMPVGTYDTHLRYFDTVFFIHVTRVGNSLLTFNPNGAQGEAFEFQYCYLDSVQMPECPFTVPGFRFRGWSKNRRGTGSDPIYKAGEVVKLLGNRTFYAIWVDSSVGVTNVEEDPVTLWPNPTSGELFVSFSAGHSAQILVVDAMGRTLLREDCPNTMNGGVKISLKDLPDGLYTVQVKTPVGIYNRRIIKQ